MDAPDPLEGLERIDWARVSHAYGPATDVPGQLRALASLDPEVRRKAMWHLWGNIHHQSTVYEATALAVPFLAALASRPGPQPRGEILLLLSAIAHGSSYTDAHHHLWAGQGADWTDEENGQRAVELAWVASARAAVESEIVSLAAMITHADLGIRLAAAALCVNFPATHAPLREIAISAARSFSGDSLARLSYQMVALAAGAPLGDVVRDPERAWAAAVLEAASFSDDVAPEGLLRALTVAEGRPFVQTVVEDLAGSVLSRELKR